MRKAGIGPGVDPLTDRELEVAGKLTLTLRYRLAYTEDGEVGPAESTWAVEFVYGAKGQRHWGATCQLCDEPVSDYGAGRETHELQKADHLRAHLEAAKDEIAAYEALTAIQGMVIRRDVYFDIFGFYPRTNESRAWWAAHPPQKRRRR